MSEIGKIYQEHYFKEFDRKGNIESNLTVPLGILTLLLGALYNITFETTPTSIFEKIFLYLFSAISFCCLSATAYRIFRANYSYDSKHLPFLNGISKYRKELYEHFENSAPNEVSPEELADSQILAFIYDEYAKCATHNADVNDKKAYDLYHSKNLILLSAIMVLVTAIPYGVNKIISNNHLNGVQVEGNAK